MGRTNDAKAAIARQKQKKADAAKENPAGELAAKPNVPAAKTRKPRPPRRDAASRDERVKPVVKRLPPGSVITKSWDGERWVVVLAVPTRAPDGRDGWTQTADGSFRAEEEVFQMYLKSLGGGE